MKIKNEYLLDVSSQNEEGPPILELVKNIKRETAVCSDNEAENQMKIKEEGLVLDIGSENEKSFLSSDTVKVKNNSDVYGMVSKVDIQEEPWWQERTSTEMPEAASISNLEVCSEVKDGANEDFPATESTRSRREASSSLCNKTPYVFTITDEEEEEKNLKCGKKNLEFAASNIREVYESDVMETSCREQTVHFHKTEEPHEHQQTGKVNKCSNSRNNSHVCETCKKTFSHESTLKDHMSSRPYRCCVCQKTFTEKISLRNHVLIHSQIAFKCDYCGKCFTQKGDFNRHFLIHRDKRSYKCDVCEKRFTRKGNLKKHVLIHGKTPFTCDICEKSFAKKGNLKNHILIHESERPFKCNICEKSFAGKENLKKHILIHNNERPLKCVIWDKSFKHKVSLLNRAHNCETRYKCNHCEKGFTQKVLFRNHTLIHEVEKPF